MTAKATPKKKTTNPKQKGETKKAIKRSPAPVVPADDKKEEAPMEPKTRAPALSVEKFIEIWQTSNTMKEVCEKTGYNATYAAARAVKLRKDLRKHNGDLKSFRGARYDYAKLAALANGFVATPETAE